VKETAEDLRHLQGLLDASREKAGPHLRSIFRPERALTAQDLVELFAGPRQIALATVTARGEPRVSPVDAVLLRGRFHFGTSGQAARIRHLRSRPALSLTYFERDELAVVAHGKAELLEFGHPDFREVDDALREIYGGTPSTEQENVVLVRVEPTALFTFSRRS
jgi:uncharacterized pyridoxamine 5'-phosphate oxidase family protein